MLEIKVKKIPRSGIDGSYAIIVNDEVYGTFMYKIDAQFYAKQLRKRILAAKPWLDEKQIIRKKTKRKEK